MTTQSIAYRRTRRGALAAGLLATMLGASALPLAAAQAQEINLTIRSVRAIDKADAAGEGLADFYARVTIAGETFKTEFIKDQDVIRPKWIFTKRVAPGIHDVKVEILDKDVAVDDPIDINRVDNKRDLDFQIDTRSCVITGFSNAYRCGSIIQRQGLEKKSAGITFVVTVKR